MNCNAEYNESGNVDKHTHCCTLSERHNWDTPEDVAEFPHLCGCGKEWSQ